MWTTPRQTLPAPPPIEESRSLAEFTPPTGYEPKLLDDFHNSETTEMIFQEESGDKETVPSYLCDAEVDDETIGKALSSPLFVQERGESADRRQAYHSHEENLLPAHSFFAHSRTGETRARTKFVKFVQQRKNQGAKWKTKQSGFSLKDKTQILADFRAEIQRHECQADSYRRSIQELN